jgi:hypothetical protein
MYTAAEIDHLFNDCVRLRFAGEINRRDARAALNTLLSECRAILHTPS